MMEQKREEIMTAGRQGKSVAKKKHEGYMTTLAERISYASFFVGQNFYIILVTLFLITFFTDIGIPAATLSVIMLVVKVWDAVNDPIMGGLIDKAKFKSGKFLPWLRAALFAIPITTVAVFAIPSGIPLAAKVVWAAVGYMLWDAAYTICDVPIFGLITTLTDNQEERNSVMSLGRVGGILGALLVSVVVPLFRTMLGGWLPTVVVICAVGLLFLLPVCFTAKERVASVNADENVSVKDMFRYVKSNKYMLIFFIAMMISTAMNLGMVLNMYFMRYCLGNEQLLAISSLLFLFPGILAGILMPALSKKIDKFLLYRWSLGIQAILMFVSFFVGYTNPTAYWTFSVLKALPGGMALCLGLMFAADCAEYGNFTTGIDASGTVFALQAFSVKLGAALATSLGALALALMGFVETEGAIQPAGFNERLWFSTTIIAGIGLLAAFLILGTYKLRDKDVQAMARANRGELSREEAIQALSPALAKDFVK